MAHVCSAAEVVFPCGEFTTAATPLGCGPRDFAQDTEEFLSRTKKNFPCKLETGHTAALKKGKKKTSLSDGKPNNPTLCTLTSPQIRGYGAWRAVVGDKKWEETGMP